MCSGDDGFGESPTSNVKGATSFLIGFAIAVALASGPAYRWAMDNTGVGFGILPAALAWADSVLLLVVLVLSLGVVVVDRQRAWETGRSG